MSLWSVLNFRTVKFALWWFCFMYSIQMYKEKMRSTLRSPRCGTESSFSRCRQAEARGLDPGETAPRAASPGATSLHPGLTQKNLMEENKRLKCSLICCQPAAEGHCQNAAVTRQHPAERLGGDYQPDPRS